MRPLHTGRPLQDCEDQVSFDEPVNEMLVLNQNVLSLKEELRHERDILHYERTSLTDRYRKTNESLNGLEKKEVKLVTYVEHLEYTVATLMAEKIDLEEEVTQLRGYISRFKLCVRVEGHLIFPGLKNLTKP